jgi:hypothetical protein
LASWPRELMESRRYLLTAEAALRFITCSSHRCSVTLVADMFDQRDGLSRGCFAVPAMPYMIDIIIIMGAGRAELFPA